MQHELGQVVVLLPDCVALGRAPGSQIALEQLRLLILLLLGCAVQGPTKELFISRIKELPIDIQHEIVDCIKQVSRTNIFTSKCNYFSVLYSTFIDISFIFKSQVTEDQKVVLTLDWKDQSSEHLYTHLRDIISIRDGLLNQWVNEISQENVKVGNKGSSGGGIETNHLAVELADWKARFRKQRQEL